MKIRIEWLMAAVLLVVAAWIGYDYLKPWTLDKVYTALATAMVAVILFLAYWLKDYIF